MKQRITREDFEELSNVQKENIKRWWKPQVGDWGYYCPEIPSDKIGVATYEFVLVEEQEHYDNCYPLLSIGQMIEFLEEHNTTWEMSTPQREIDSDLDTWMHKEDDEWFEKMGMVNPFHWNIHQNSVGFYTGPTEDLCDMLWGAVIYTLNYR